MVTHTTLAPLNLDNPAPYLVDNPIQIEHLLGRLAKRPELVCLYHPERREPFALSALLQIDARQLVFDSSPDEQINKLLRSAPQLICVSNLDRVHIQFNAPQPSETLHEGRLAFSAQRPQSLLFVQRRDYFRLNVPARQPVLCQLPLDQELPPLKLEVLDISLGGLALPGHPALSSLPAGTVLPGCRLSLPEVGELGVSLQLSRIREYTERSGGTPSLRIGCRLLALSPGEQTLIQRYIHRVERSRVIHE